MKIIGVDCAAQPEKCGLAFGERSAKGWLRISDVEQGLGKDNDFQCIAQKVNSWLGSGPALLAVDAPLGWPIFLQQALSKHVAGKRSSSLQASSSAHHCLSAPTTSHELPDPPSSC